MGELRLKTQVRTSRRGRARELDMLLDSGSYASFIRGDAAATLGHVIPLPDRVRFHGAGNGSFSAGQVVNLWVRLAGVWVTHVVYVVPPRTFEHEGLLGHDFMQRYGIVLDMRRERTVIDPRRVKRANWVL